MVYNMQVRAICYELGISERDTVLLRQVDRATERGEKGIEVFAVLDGVDETAREAALGRLFAKYDSFAENVKSRAEGGDLIAKGMLNHSDPALQREDMERMYTDPDFRSEMWETYSGRVLPKLREMGDDQGYSGFVAHMLDTEFADDNMTPEEKERFGGLMKKVMEVVSPAGYKAMEEEYVGQPHSEKES